MQAQPRKTLWAWILGTFFGSGLLKPGPGTYGSIAALLLWYATAHALHPTPSALAVGTAVAALVITLVGIPAATIVARESRQKDPGHVVIDEAAGQLITLILRQAGLETCSPRWPVLRLFDIVKPWPIRKLERLPDGTGIMLDDVAAGLLALACVYALSVWIR